MQAIIIDGKTQTIQQAELASMDDIIARIGFDSVIGDELDSVHRIYFDEDCFLRGTLGRFQIDTLPPIAGVAVILGSTETGVLAESSLTVEEVQERTRFL